MHVLCTCYALAMHLLCIYSALTIVNAFYPPQIFVNLAQSVLDSLLSCPRRIWRA